MNFRSLLLGLAIPVGLLPALLNAQVPSAPVIVASSYFDGGGYQYGWDTAWACATDAAGNFYVAGDSQEPGFPTTTNAVQKSFGAGGQDGFVAKFDRNGNLLWSTFLGGSAWDGVYDVTTDANGNAVVTGVTASSDFPTSPNAIQKTIASGAYVAFVTVISADGTQILYSTFLGGSIGDNAPPLPVNIGHVIPQDGTYTTGVGVAVGNDGTIYICGGTDTIDMPVTSSAAQPAIAGEEDGYVARIDPTKSGSAGLLYCTYLGGALSDFGAAVTVDPSGNAFVTGEAQSENFPTTVGAFQKTHLPGTAAFVTKLSPDGTSLIYSTLVSGSQGSSAGGGTNYTAPSAIVIDKDGHAYIAGETNDTDFPTTAGVVQQAFGGQDDGFVTELATDGSALVFSTYLGGGDYDGLFGLKLDESGNIFVAGYTASRDLPQVNAFQSNFGGYNDWLIAELAPGGTTLLLSSFFGGGDQEYAHALDLRDNQLYLAGTTVSQNFPVTNCAANPSYNGAAGDVSFAVVHLPATPTQLAGAVSRKNHGSAGSFDVDLPLSGKLGVECRSGGEAGDYTVVFKFADPLAGVGCVDVSAAGATIADETIGTDPHEYVVNLTGVANAQTVTVTLNNISDSSGHFSSSASVAMDVLVGDSNGDGFVNSADISQTKAQSGQQVSATNFREDLNDDGFINSADIGLVKSKSGTALP